MLGTYRAAYAGLPRATWVLFWVALINRSGTMVVPFLALYLTSKLGYDLREAGLFLAVFGAGAMTGSYLGGWLADRLGATRVQVLSLCATGLGFFALAAVSGTAALASVLLAIGVVAEIFRPANSTALAETCPEPDRRRAFALNRLAINLGMAVGPGVGGFLAVAGYGWLFLVDGATCLLAGCLLWVFTRRIPPVVPPPAGPARRDTTPWRDRTFLLAMLCAVVVAVLFLQAASTLPLYFHSQYGLREDAIGLLFAANPVIIVAFEMVLVHKLGHRDALHLVAAGALLVGVGLGLLPFGTGFLFGLLTVVVWTVGEMLESPNLAGFVAERAGPTHRGSYMGIYSLAYAIAFVAAPLAGTAVYQELGPDVLWLGCGALGLAASGGYLMLARRARREGGCGP